MITKTIRGGNGSFADQTHPGTNYRGATYLRVNATSGSTRLAFLTPGWKPPRDTQIISAKLRLRARQSSSGARTITVKRVASSWKAGGLTWNNRPGVTGGAATVSVGALSDADLVEIDVTSHMQTVANGSAFYGWRIETSGTTNHSFYSINAGGHNPQLWIQYAYKPAAPTGLLSGGVVSTGAPYLSFDYNVFSGNLKLSSIQVQIDPNANASAPAWDSGALATTTPEVDLATTSYPGLANGATTYWRVRYTTSDGLASPYSSWATFSRVAKGVLSIDAPADVPNNQVTESTPPILWTFTNQTAWQLIIHPQGLPSQRLLNTGIRGGVDQSYTLPAKILKTRGAWYTVKIRCWDNVGRVVTANDTTYVQAARDFQFVYSSATAPVTGLGFTQPTGFPRARLTFQRSAAPDSFHIERDGEVIAANIDPDDLLVSGIDYAYEDWTAAPFTDHTWAVVPVVNGKAADANPTVTARFRAVGVWVGDPATGWYFNLLEADPSGLAYGEDAEVTPKFAEVTRKISSMRGLEGQISGGVLVSSEYDPRPMATQLGDVWLIKARGQRVFRLLVADINAPVILGEVSPAPSSDFLEGIEQRRVSLSVWQRGELPFKPVAGA